jgi:hypothetical protein
MCWRRDRPTASVALLGRYKVHSSRIDCVMAEVMPPVE